ncbi:MAG: exodeoxyribonuclease VII large subunit [Ruminococcaceae bacterium]|jgi:exodeoxyribonuclease VII large subunit|nr:exodeoxyribonuclease VII large subunit [Oscillospiraceae bacterium]
MAVVYYSDKQGAGQNDRFPDALTVTQLNEFMKRMIDASPRLSGLYVRGEISNFKNHYATGHWYFTLKDEGSQIAAVMFRSAAAKMKFVPEDGMRVTARGRVSAYVRGGSYQLYADGMEPDGVGALYIAFEQLKRRLEAEGLFDPARKKPLPKIPTRIGIITSPTGAAVRDMINVTGRRFPYAKLTLWPSLVQGEDAPPQLCEGLRYFNETKSANVIIIGRGGGSMEDLWAFNDERVVRAVAASSIPVISAVGHETDFTLCDFAADQRAPTPSAAAELSVPDGETLKRQIAHIVTREADVLRAMIRSDRQKLNALGSRRVLTDPHYFIDERRMTLDLLTDRLARAGENRIESRKAALAACAGKLSALDPLSVLSRGYSAVYREDGRLVRSVDDVKPGDKVSFRTVGGEALCSVEEVKENQGR